MLPEQSLAPNFQALDQDGQAHELQQYHGQWVLLYFYPRDNTPGCTKEACALRDQHPAFKQVKAVILGVSSDSVASHAKFAAKWQLPFTLLADPDKKIINAYRANGLVRRISYLINPDGLIAKIYPRVKPAEHAETVKQDLINLQK